MKGTKNDVTRAIVNNASDDHQTDEHGQNNTENKFTLREKYQKQYSLEKPLGLPETCYQRQWHQPTHMMAKKMAQHFTQTTKTFFLKTLAQVIHRAAMHSTFIINPAILNTQCATRRTWWSCHTSP